MASRPFHFDMSAEDPERMIAFYERTFGWTVQRREGPNEYWHFTTGSEGPGIDGGIWRREPGMNPSTVNTIQVEAIDETLKAITAAGGTVLIGKMEIPEIGLWAQAVDPEGNKFGVLQVA